jgi:diguanylate cyclase (GGDEF)-like protein
VLLVGTGGHAAGLRRSGSEVTELPSPQPALDWVAGHAVDVVVAGDDLPVNASLEFFHALEQRQPGVKKILLAHNMALSAVARSLNQARVDFFLVHPFAEAELAQAVEHVFNLRRLERERDRLHAENARIMEELRSFNSVLEQRVRERTDELTVANARLAEALREIEQKNRALTLLNESLNIQATVDPLTGLFNRREFRNRLQGEWARFKRHKRPISLVMLDIDHFKQVNDSHGHECGDAVLQGLGAILRGQQRRHDIACRYGGEEFIVLLPETLLDAAFLVAEGMRKRVSNHVFRYKELRLSISISLGVAGALEHNPGNEDEFINLADQALYRAKAEGRNRTVVLEPHSDRIWKAGA